MKKLLLAFVTVGALALPAQAQPYYVSGDFEGWTGAGPIMTDMGGGIWSVDLTGVGGFHEYKITDGSWANNWPGSGNSWFYGDGSGNITLTFDVNTYADGWSGSWGRMGVSTDPGAWTAVGDWQSTAWVNNDPSTAMTPQGGGIYKLSYVIPTPNWYEGKAVNTGSWNSIGADFRSVNGDNLWFETTAPNQQVDFLVDAFAGTIKIDVIPEPSTFALLGLALAGMAWLRRR